MSKFQNLLRATCEVSLVLVVSVAFIGGLIKLGEILGMWVRWVCELPS